MRFEPLEMAGVARLRLDVHSDARGCFARTFCEAEFEEAGLPFRVLQANLSRNIAAGTLRGMHYQQQPHGEAKIVSCVRGRIFDVAVDLRPDSPTYRRWLGVELTPDAGAIHLPAGVAHGFLTLEPDSEVHYLMGAPYRADAQRGLRWDDPAIGIRWPRPPAVISERDAGYADLER